MLIERNLRLVAHIVKKYQYTDYESEDLLSVGTIGLIKAVSTFKTDRGSRLATYAAKCVENARLSQRNKLNLEAGKHNRPPQSAVAAVGGFSMYSCFCGLPFRFDSIHHCIHQFQLLLGGTGHFFNHLPGVFCVEAGQRFLQLFFSLLCPGQDQENLYVCPSFLRAGSIYAAGPVHYPIRL